MGIAAAAAGGHQPYGALMARWPAAAPDPEWFAFVQAGDVLRAPSGLLRIVRRVSRHRGRPWVYFAIRHPSWTKRAYTVFTPSDLKTMGYQYVGARVKLQGEMDRRLAAAIDEKTHLSRGDYSLTCYDVAGVP